MAFGGAFGNTPSLPPIQRQQKPAQDISKISTTERQRVLEQLRKRRLLSSTKVSEDLGVLNVRRKTMGGV